jgi:dihydroorotate dehydrogenase
VYSLLRRLLFLLPAETAHRLAFGLLRVLHWVPLLSTWLRKACSCADPRLEVTALGHRFRSPVGLAAGFDKNATAYRALGDLGFGFVEVGTVTAEPQPGNPRPRLFRLPQDRAIVNRMGFNNDGALCVAPRLIGRRRVIVGVNIGKTKRVDESGAIADYQKSARALGPHADYLVVNVSSPNTPGLRNLQAVEKLRPLLLAVKSVLQQTSTDAPLLVKIAPDMSDADIDAIADMALDIGLDGIIATNTTVSREGLGSERAKVERAGAGGLSGPPLKARSLQVLRRLRARAGTGLLLVSVGGVETADDVWERLQAGATLVQLYTSLVYEGPGLVARLHRDLLARLEREGIGSLEQVIGRQREVNPTRRSNADTSPSEHPLPGSV